MSVVVCFSEQVRQTSVRNGLGRAELALGQEGGWSDPLQFLPALFCTILYLLTGMQSMSSLCRTIYMCIVAEKPEIPPKNWSAMWLCVHCEMQHSLLLWQEVRSVWLLPSVPLLLRACKDKGSCLHQSCWEPGVILWSCLPWLFEDSLVTRFKQTKFLGL